MEGQFLYVHPYPQEATDCKLPVPLLALTLSHLMRCLGVASSESLKTADRGEVSWNESTDRALAGTKLRFSGGTLLCDT